jgi:hypothetical protein
MAPHIRLLIMELLALLILVEAVVAALVGLTHPVRQAALVS